MSSKYLLQIDKAVLKDLQDLPAKQYKQVVSKLLSLSLQPYQPKIEYELCNGGCGG
jgi:mRNA-degrading endonuclease RelE of RelBE toxin-antitoxin system